MKKNKLTNIHDNNNKTPQVHAITKNFNTGECNIVVIDQNNVIGYAYSEESQKEEKYHYKIFFPENYKLKIMPNGDYFHRDSNNTYFLSNVYSTVCEALPEQIDTNICAMTREQRGSMEFVCASKDKAKLYNYVIKKYPNPKSSMEGWEEDAYIYTFSDSKKVFQSPSSQITSVASLHCKYEYTNNTNNILKKQKTKTRKNLKDSFFYDDEDEYKYEEYIINNTNNNNVKNPLFYDSEDENKDTIRESKVVVALNNGDIFLGKQADIGSSFIWENIAQLSQLRFDDAELYVSEQNLLLVYSQNRKMLAVYNPETKELISCPCPQLTNPHLSGDYFTGLFQEPDKKNRIKNKLLVFSLKTGKNTTYELSKQISDLLVIDEKIICLVKNNKICFVKNFITSSSLLAFFRKDRDSLYSQPLSGSQTSDGIDMDILNNTP
ncbi:MAG: hypothetical protein QM652_01765 [Legionella sp.]|uniref:hypothetical protein n=1 Tax=Legionella sp. TaxID=459 RepID=UPI0039E70B50